MSDLEIPDDLDTHLPWSMRPSDPQAVTELLKAGIHPKLIPSAYCATHDLARLSGFGLVTCAEYTARVLAWFHIPVIKSER